MSEDTDPPPQDGVRATRDHRLHSVGGWHGHWYRRLLHVSMGITPFMFYWWGDAIGGSINVTERQFVTLVALLIGVAEFIRLRFSITVFGQRAYEAKQVSALAWGGLAVSLTFLIAPTDGGTHVAAFGLPIIWTLSFGDPVMGEVRRAGLGDRHALVAGIAVAAIVWTTAALWLGTPWWLVPLMAPLSAVAETPRLPWIDDNATMVFIPLTAVVLLAPWI